jgi:hypothetical protein
MPGAYISEPSSIKTPQSSGRIVPSREEMHPELAHQSTAKKPDEGLSLGFVDVDAVKTTPTKSTNTTIPTLALNNSVGTPSKATCIPNNNEFKWSRPETVLSPEAQRIMESVREQAAKIKFKMQEEREKQADRDGETAQLFGVAGRKIATPKGKAGRFSDVHKEEFKKMDSIANHVSAWKNKFQAGSSGLKRSKSKAGFDEDRPTSQASSSDNSAKSPDTGRLENTSPGKRMKRTAEDDTSAARPVSRGSQVELSRKPSIPGLIRSKTGIPLPSAAITPTKASLARAASVKRPDTASKIPSLGRSKSMKTLPTPHGSKTEGSNKHESSMSRFGNLKSILHKPNPKYSNDLLKVAEGTHIPLPKSPSRLNKDLPRLPTITSPDISTSPSTKAVSFTPTTKSTYELAVASPTPSKLPAPHYASAAGHPLPRSPSKLTYPQLTRPDPLNLNPTIPGDFTFRSPQTIKVGPATSGLTSPSTSASRLPNPAPATSTIRQVRPSGIPTTLPFFANIGAVPHGMPNKKRRRVDEEDSDVENQAPDKEEAAEEGPVTKKVKSGREEMKSGEGSKAEKKSGEGSMAQKRREKGKTGAKAGKRGILSLGRLNMLARPKERK